MKQIIRITESELKRIVAEAIMEIGDTAKGQFALGAVSGRTVGKRNYHNLGSEERAEGDRIRNDAEDEAWRNRRGSSDEKMGNARKQGYNYGFEKGKNGKLD